MNATSMAKAVSTIVTAMSMAPMVVGESVVLARVELNVAQVVPVNSKLAMSLQ